jgi:parallel beta-helix repeat protein
MQPNRIWIVTLLLTVTLMTIAIVVTADEADAMKAHDPIRIDSRTDFLELDLPGTGTADDPFVIEGLEINATGRGVGIYVGNVSNFEIRENYIYGAGSPTGKPHQFAWDAGIALFNVNGFNIVDNWIADNRGPGLHLEGAHQGDVSTNTLVGNGRGLYASLSQGAMLLANTFSNNTGYAVHLGPEAGSARIVQNNFIDNNRGAMQQALDEGQRNTWNDAVGGNFWSDMQTRYPRAMPRDDTVWDTPYDVGSPIAKIQDGLPLIKRIDKASPMLISFTTPGATTGDLISVRMVIYDNLGVRTVNATERTTNQTLHFTEAFPTVWKATMVAPSDSVEPLFFIARAMDIRGNTATYGGHTVKVTDNDPPTAEAGEDIVVKVGEPFVLDATKSSDNIGIVNYTWEFLGDDDFSWFVFEPKFELMEFESGDVTAWAHVRDEAGNKAKDRVNITVELDFEPKDTDGDGEYDVFDDDDDNDGWTDFEETRYFFTDPLDKDSFPLDTDGDGIPDLFDPDDDNDGYADWDEEMADSDKADDAEIPDDFDSDGDPDYRDTDDDGDGYVDDMETLTGSDAYDNTSVPKDTDGDGTYDFWDDDDDNDGVLDWIEKVAGTDQKDSSSFPPDTDGDGQADYLDLDDDNDGVNDYLEEAAGTDTKDDGSVPADTDGDGLYDFQDDDDDNDGVLDSVELETGFDPKDDTSVPPDTDNDGTIDALDSDSDGDTIPDEVELLYGLDPLNPADAAEDADGDGVSNAEAIVRGWNPTKKEQTTSDPESDPGFGILAAGIAGGLLVGALAGAGACSMRKRPGRTTYEPSRSAKDNPLTRTDRSEDSMSMASFADGSEPGMVNVSQVQQETGLPEVGDEVLTASDAHGHVTVLKSADVPGAGGHEIGHQLGSSQGSVPSSTDAESRIPDRLTHRNRAVSQSDFQDLSSSEPGADVSRVEAQPSQSSPRGIEKDPLGARGVEKDPLGVTGHSQGSTVGLGEAQSSSGSIGHEAAHTVQQTGEAPGGDGGGTRAQDYNSSRSNNEAVRDTGSGGDSGDTRAQDYNSSRSNNEAARDTGSGGDSDGTRAQDYNSSRSNNESTRTTDGDGGGEGGKDGKGKARKSGNESSAIGTLR